MLIQQFWCLKQGSVPSRGIFFLSGHMEIFTWKFSSAKLAEYLNLMDTIIYGIMVIAVIH